ncbi:MAG: DMT family transporter, partial [Gammaproteobacteria bacterium]|nr:DMT family transporter [Gammaproteobacteria bacterium]
LSIPLLGESVGRHRWSAVLVGFAGVLWMLQPTGDGWLESVALLPLATAIAYALLQVLTRRHADRETTQAYVFWYTLLLTLAAGGALLVFPGKAIQPDDWLPMVAVGMAGFVSTILMVQAYRLAEASFVAPFDYTALVWSGLLGWFFWAEVPSATTLTGAVVVVSAGLYILHRELRRRALPT